VVRRGCRSLSLATRQPASAEFRVGSRRNADFWTGTEMGSRKVAALYVVVMAAVIVVIDLLFFKNRFWERLTVNVGIVLIFVAFYFRFLKRP
jgi:hypothetical protein